MNDLISRAAAIEAVMSAGPSYYMTQTDTGFQETHTKLGAFAFRTDIGDAIRALPAATPAPVVPAEGLALLEEALSRKVAYDESALDTLDDVRGMIADAITALRSAPHVGARVTGWQQIETAPHEELVVLGWQEDGAWKQEIALASAGERFPNGYSNMWTHGRATHWMPLPEPPAALLPAGEVK